ncbi:MAG TPA: hypothetical protein PLF60_06255, partial [Bacillota bacterium]|nr:hypothetical protein [Bacillota bacterium]
MPLAVQTSAEKPSGWLSTGCPITIEQLLLTCVNNSQSMHESGNFGCWLLCVAKSITGYRHPTNRLNYKLNILIFNIFNLFLDNFNLIYKNDSKPWKIEVILHAESKAPGEAQLSG